MIRGREEQEGQGGIVIETHTAGEGRLGRSVHPAFQILPPRSAGSKAPRQAENQSYENYKWQRYYLALVAKGIQYKNFTEVSTDI